MSDVLHWVRKDEAMLLVPYQSADDEMLWIADARDLTYGEWLDDRYAGTAPEPRPEYGPRYVEPQRA